MTGLLGLKSLVKKYEFDLDDSRQGLYSILGESIGHMGALVNLVVNSEEEQAYKVLYLICKVFYSAN